MDVIFKQAVRERAYALWLEAGMVDGQDRVHWFAAEAAVKSMGSGAGAVAKAAVTEAAPVKPTATKAASTKSAVTKVAGVKKAPVKAVAPAKLAKTGDETAAKVTGKSRSATKAAASAQLAT